MAEGNTLRPSPAQNKLKLPLSIFFKDVRNVFKLDSIGKEILQIAVPAAMALAADPIASLIDTAFIGRIGPVELAAVGVSIAIFNQASKITIFPLVSITTSFVAQEETTNKIAKSDQPQPQPQPEGADDHQNHMHIHTYHDDSSKQLNTQDAHGHVLHKLEEGLASHKLAHDDQSLPNDTNNILKMSATLDPKGSTSKDKIATRKRHIPSASTALVLGGLLGLAQAIFLVFGAKTLLGVMGVKHDSPMLKPAHRYLTIRSLGAPAVLLSLAMQGVFRGC